MGAARKTDIYGAKGGSEKPKTPTEAPDSLRSVAIAKMLIAIGEGEFEGTPTARDIYLDNTPLQDPQGNMNFPNVKWEWRTGAVDQTYIPGIPSIENETTISTELRSGTPWVRAISNTQLSAVRVRFAWPALQSVDANNNINGYRIQYKVELATDGGAYQEVLSEAVDGKTTNLYERTRRIDLPKATSGWLMRITRLTVNQNSPGKFSDIMQIAGFTEVIDAKIRYPNTALLYIEFSAEQFRSIPAVTVGCKSRKWQVPSNYDPVSRTYNGIWDGTLKEAYTNNPTWATLGITTNDRFGLGRRIKPWMVDKWELYRISQYCDQLVPDGKGGQEPRFICNLNLQSKADAWSLLRDISAIYRAMTYWAQGQVFTLADMPRATDFDFAYTRANVIDGKFTYSSASERTRYSRALVSYDNPLNNYDTDVTAVTDQKLQRRYGDNPLEISAIGCTRESEAQRRGKWALLTNSKDRAVTFKVGLDGRIPLPGYVIPIADELLAGRPVGGRISAVNGKVITLDRDTQAKPGDRLILNLPDGKCEGRTVQLVSGRQVTVTVAYSVAPEPELVWALDADDLAIPLYRVVSVARPEPGVFEISAVQYDPSKFAHIDTGARLEDRPISVVPVTVVPAPASLDITSNYSVDQGLAISTMNISWPAVSGAVAYDVEWRKDSGNWIKLQRTGSTSVDVTGIYSGAYLARVRSVSAFEISSIWKSSNLTNLEGKVGLPPAVAFLTTTSLVYGIGIQWGFPPGAEDTQRTEVWYSESPDLTTAVKLSDFSYPQASHEMHSLLAGATLFFWARLVDRTGNVGPFFPTPGTVNGQASSDQSEYEKYFADKISEGALWKPLRDRIDLIDGPETLAGSVAQRVAAEATARAKAVSDEALARAQGLLAEAQARGTAITSEANARVAADSALGQRIDTVTAATGGNAAAIQTEITARTNADSALGQRIDTVASGTAANTAAIGNETTARTNADTALASQISTIRAQSGGFDTSLNFDFASTVEGWIGARCDLSVETGRMIVTNTSANAYLSLPGTSINGREHDRVRCRITRRAGSGWNGQITYVTPSHGSSTSFNKIIPDPGLTIGQSVIVEWDMSQLTNGGNDWSSSTITRLYLWLSSASGDVFEVDWIAIGRIAPSASVASVVDERTARIAGDESNASATTALASSLTITNTNVTAAQNAANAANTLAGGKGKVIVQAAAPAAADQLPQNLWIDITGGANTPKRWTGSVWAAVTDKVATDAAKAATDALALVNTKADASALNILATTVAEVDGKLTAQASALQSLEASYRDDNGEGDLADALKGFDATAKFASEVRTRAAENEAAVSRLASLDASVGDNSSNLSTLEQVVVTNESATATKIDQLSVKVGDNSSAIQQTSTALADTNGKLNTMWSVKMQVTADGQYVAASVGLGIENTPGGLQSQFLVSADRFAIVNSMAGGAVSVPFAVQGGQVFMKSAFIQDGSITMLKIGQSLQSDNYVAGVSGWQLSKSGIFEINGSVPGQGRMTMTNRSLRVYDAAGQKRVQLGDLSE